MINEQLLLEKGYKKFNEQRHLYCDTFYQKRVKDAYGDTKYFINCYEYNFPREKEPRYEFKIYFEKNKLNYMITIYGEVNLEEVEQEIERLWIENKFNYYGMGEE